MHIQRTATTSTDYHNCEPEQLASTMTNKHKKAVNAKKTKAKASDTSPNEPVPSMEQPQLKSFTRAQLAALIFISIACSKILEFATALKEGSEDPKTCMSYLNDEETCTHASFSSMILVKHYSALSLVAIVLSMMWHLWKSETLFLKLMTCICISPLSTTILAAIYSQGYVEQDRIWHLIIMSSVLFATCVPTTAQQLAFLPDQPWTARSLQSMCLITLAISSLLDIYRVVDNSNNNNWENSLLETTTPFPEAARGLIHFWLVDKLSIALLFVFAVVHFPEHTQRVSITNVHLSTSLTIC
jgi:hypothetical protein